MNKKFLSVMLLATFFLGSASLFIACSDDDTVYDDTSVTSQISSLTSQLATLQSALTEAQNAASAAQSTADDALANAASAASAAASAADDAAAANNAALAANQAAEAASALAEAAAATAKAEAIEEAIKQTKELIAASEEATDEQIQALALLIEGIDSDLNELSGALNGVSEDVKANAAAIVALQEQMTAVEKYKEDIESLSKTIASIESDLTAVSNRVDGIEVDLKGLSSDVTNLTETVTAIQSSLLALTGNVNDLSSTLNGLLGDFSNLSDYVDNLSSTLTSLSGTVSDLSSIVDGKCTMDEVKDYIAQVLSGDTQVVYTKDEVDELLADIAKQISDINEALSILQTYQITSLVFIPELYVNGIEATRFAYASGVAWGEKVFAKTTGTTSESYAYVIPENSIGNFYQVTTTKEKVYYNLAPATEISYRYNPSSADLSRVTFGFDVEDVEAITRASVPTWKAEIESTSDSKGLLHVYYRISSSGIVNLADSLCDPKDDQDGKVSVMSLKATLANDTTVYSDYAAIVPAKRKIDYIAFTTESTCTAVKGSSMHYSSYNDAYDLYQNAQDAAESAPSIECVYNGGALNLAELLCVHYTQADYGDFGTTTRYCEGIMNLADLESWGLSLEFASIPFQVGANGTDQSRYCIVTEDGEFTPAYLSETETTTAIEKNSTSGKSSIGRTPLVVVKLVDGNGSVVAFGYVRIKITEAATTTPEDDYITVESKETAYDCDTYSYSVSWDNISANLYEYEKVSAAYFRSHYTTDSKTYIKNAKGKFVESSDYGTISQSGDLSGDNTTTVLKVMVDADQKFNIVEDTDNRTDTIYIKYSYGSDVVYVGFGITVLDLPDVTFTDKISMYWDDEKGGELNDDDEARLNVPAPGTGKAVTNYTKTLNELFQDSKVVATLAGENKDEYKASEVNFTYSFDTTQDKIGSYSLYVNAGGDSLFANKSMDDQYLVAYFTNPETGEINYAITDVAKEILNLYPHDNDILAHAKVKLNATYGTCEHQLEYRTFIVDFLRPIDIVAGEDAIFEDATAAGDTVSLANLITIKDWRDKTVYSKKYSTGYLDNGVNLYNYYEFQTIEVDLAKAKYNDLDKLASGANIQLSLVDKNGNSLSSNTLVITSANVLSNIYIKQSNTGNVTSDYTLQIPIKVTYAWGTVECKINAQVKKTMGS